MKMPCDEDIKIFEIAVNTHFGSSQISKTCNYLDAQLRQKKFCTERAEEVFSMAVDNIIHDFFKSIGQHDKSLILFPKDIRAYFWIGMVKQYKDSREILNDDRPQNTGIKAFFIGK